MSENNANCHKRECPLYDECWLCDGEQTCIDRLSDYQQGRTDAEKERCSGCNIPQEIIDNKVNDAIDEFTEFYKKRYLEEYKMNVIIDFTIDIIKEFKKIKEQKNE